VKKREKAEKLLELLGELEENYIKEAEPDWAEEVSAKRRKGNRMQWILPCAAGLLLLCMAGGILRVVKAEDAQGDDQEKPCVTQPVYRYEIEKGKPAFHDVYVKRYEIVKLGVYYHPIDAEGALCNNTYRIKSHETTYTEITIPERVLSDGSTTQYSRLNYFSSYRCTSCGYVYSEEELERILLFESAEAEQ